MLKICGTPGRVFKTRPGVPHILQNFSKFAKYVSGVHIFSDQVHILQIFGS